MVVRRIVANIAADQLDETHRQDALQFYRDMLGLEVVMDQGWILTFQGAAPQPVQLSIASQGGSGAPVPDISIEVETLDAVFARITENGHEIVYDLTTEPWGVRRFMVRDPFGKLLNILSHQTD